MCIVLSSDLLTHTSLNTYMNTYMLLTPPLSLSLTHTHTHTHIHARGMKPQDIPLGDGTGKISTLKARVSLDSQVTENYFCYGVMITSQVLTLSYSWGRGEGGRGANRAMAPLRPSK